MFRVEFGELPGIFEDVGRVRSVEGYWAESERREAPGPGGVRMRGCVYCSWHFRIVWADDCDHVYGPMI